MNTTRKINLNCQNFLATSIVLLIFMLSVVPVFAASSNYGFTMEYRVVSGNENGQYHSLEKGTAKISGSQTCTKIGLSSTPSMNPVTYILLLEQVGPDKTIGSVSGGAKSGSVSGTFGNVSTASTKYYLQVAKSAVDNWRVVGSGQIKN